MSEIIKALVLIVLIVALVVMMQSISTKQKENRESQTSQKEEGISDASSVQGQSLGGRSYSLSVAAGR
jgi:uncharacterized membrane protein